MFYTTIQNSSAHTQSRTYCAKYIVENMDKFPELVSLCFQINDKTHIKACYVLDKFSETNLTAIFPILDYICSHLKDLKNDSAIRCISRIIMFVVEDNSEEKHYLTDNQLEKITEICFDWLISDLRVAPKAHAIYTLFQLGKQLDWIHPELTTILEQDAAKHSAGYKAVARNILKKMAVLKV